MMFLRFFMDGKPLYDVVTTPYGPAYYFAQWLVYSVAHVPLTTDSVRFVALGYWLCSIELLGIAITALSRNCWLAAAGQISLFCALHVIVNEPGHPQELISLLLAVAVAGTAFLAPSRTAWLPLFLGLIAGTIFQAKLNLGAFAIAACSMTIVSFLQPSRAGHMLKTAAATCAILLPPALMMVHLDNPGWQRYALLTSFAIVPLLLVSFNVGESRFQLRDLRIFVLCCLGSTASWVAFVFARGTTVGGMIRASRALVQVIGFAPPRHFLTIPSMRL